jgi:hypothetical protein
VRLIYLIVCAERASAYARSPSSAAGRRTQARRDVNRRDRAQTVERFGVVARATGFRRLVTPNVSLVAATSWSSARHFAVNWLADIDCAIDRFTWS